MVGDHTMGVGGGGGARNVQRAPIKMKGIVIYLGVPRFESQTTGPQTNNSPFVDFLVQFRGGKNNCEAWVLDPNRLEEARPWWCFTVGSIYVYIIT